MSQDTDMGFLDVTGQGHNPSSFCHEVASCSYEPADRTQALLRGKHRWVLGCFHCHPNSSGNPFFLARSQVILSKKWHELSIALGRKQQ